MKAHPRQSVLVGLIGTGIGSSLSPAMHEREGERLGMHYVYRTIDLDVLGLGVEHLPELVLAAERMGFNGLNITHPCKQAVVELVDDLSESAANIGAVNTVVFRDGRRHGHNTDGWGYVQSFREEIASTCRYDRILLLGAGGAGSAVAHALMAEFPCRLEIFDTCRERAAEVVAKLCDLHGNDRASVSDDACASVKRCDGLVNASPVGMTLHPGTPIDTKCLRSDLWVSDIVYFPLDTALVVAAENAGCTVLKGGGMAVYQAVRAFERFTGICPDAARMRSHFEYLVGQSDSPVRSMRDTALS